MKIRRCQEEREDFTSKDSSAFPIYIENPASNYGFCPAKATWDPEIVNLYQSLIVTSYTGIMLYEGGIAEQPSQYVEILSWFLVQYDNIKFSSRVKSVVGDGKKKPTAPSQTKKHVGAPIRR